MRHTSHEEQEPGLFPLGEDCFPFYLLDINEVYEIEVHRNRWIREILSIKIKYLTFILSLKLSDFDECTWAWIDGHIRVCL